MPWAERSVVPLTREFVLKALAQDVPFRELCRQFGISRKTGSKWLEHCRERVAESRGELERSSGVERHEGRGVRED